MRVALFSSASMLSYGGGEQGLIVACNYLQRQKVEVVIFDYDYAPIRRISTKTLRRLTNSPIIPYSGLHLFGVEELPLTRSYLAALVAMRGFDAIYTTNTSLLHTISVLFLSWVFRKRVIFEVSDPSFDPVALIYTSLPERVMKLMRMSVISRFPNIRVLNARDLRRFKRRNNQVFLLAPPSKEFRPIIKESDEFRVLFVGRSDLIQKGIDLLSDVVNETLRSNRQIRFAVLGSGGTGERVLAKLNSLYPENFEWVGFVAQPDLSRYLETSQLFISTSRYEAFPMNILEAQRNGLPVVAFDIPGSSDILKSRDQGMLVVPFDAQLFVSSILNYYEKWKSNPLAYANDRQTIIEHVGRMFRNDDLLKGFLNILRGGRAWRHEQAGLAVS